MVDRFVGSTLKMLAKEYLILMYFTCNIYRDKRFHIGKEVLSHKKPYL